MCIILIGIEALLYRVGAYALKGMSPYNRTT